MWGLLALTGFLLGAPAGTAKVVLDYQPTNATVKVDGKVQKKARSGQALRVKPGKRRIEVARKGYTTWKKTVSLKAGTTLKLKVRLKKAGKKEPVVVAAGGKKAAPKRPSKRNPAKAGLKPAGKASGKGGKAVPQRRPPKKKPAKAEGRGAGEGSGLSPARQPRNKNPKAIPSRDRNPTKEPAAKEPTRRPRKATKPSAAAPVTDTREPDGGTNYKPWAVGAFVVSGLAVTGGILVGLSADEKAQEFNDSIDYGEKQDLKDDAEIRALGANVLYGVAGTALLAGTVLWLMGDDSGYAAVAPTGDGGVMAGVGGRF
jgi:hypothetical protein